MNISVVIPTYNRGDKIQKTLDSVLNQTRPPLEIIVVDDGSSDGTPDWIEAHYGDQVRVLRTKNGGVARARNRGWKAAKGEWIAFLDHDDVWHAGKLEVMVGLAQKSDSSVGVVVCRWREVKEDVTNGGEKGSESPQFPADQLTAQAAFKWLFGWNNPIVSMSVPLVRREALAKVGGFKPQTAPADDWDLWLRLAQFYDFAFTNEVLVDYTLHAGQQRRDEGRMFRAARRVLSRYPVQLTGRPLLLWWLVWSGAFAPSIEFYKQFKTGDNGAIIGALRGHPLALLSPQWMMALLKRALGRG